MADLLSAILGCVPEGRVVHAVVGRRWVASVVEVDGERRCGLAAAWRLPGEASEAASVQGRSARDLACELRTACGLRASQALATINAALPRTPERWRDQRLEDILRWRGVDKSVVIVGHFPFVDSLRPAVGSLAVLEENPRPGDLPAHSAPLVIPNADVVVITGMAFLNRTLEDLLRLCSPTAYVILAGPSVPLSPVWFAAGVHEVCGSVVLDIEAVLRAIQVGDGFHGVHQAGVRRVSMTANPSD